jgi:aminopeptidase N
VDVDPNQAILTAIKETKSQALWRSQLLQGPSVPARLRAAQHFGGSKAEADHELLAQAFAKEPFWGVKTELATAMGTAKGKACQQALLQGLHDSDARVRKASLDNLAKFDKDTALAGVVKEILQKGDPSYAVEGAALAAYAKHSPKDAVAVLTPWLTKPSHQDVLASAALAGLGASEDPAVLKTLLSWTEAGKPRVLRAAALRGLAQLAKSKSLSDAERQQIVKTLVGGLETDDVFARFTLLQTLPELGPQAAAALPALDKLAETESRSGVRNRIKSVASRIRAQSGAPGGGDDVTQLRDQVRRLEREQEELRKRLEKFEAGDSKGAPRGK